MVGIWEEPLLEKGTYQEQIYKVQDYIEKHLDEPLTADVLCKVAGFSPFHFQRIFSLITGEPLHVFIKRIRLERAAYMLLADKNRPIIDIALSVGFSNQSSFAKAFKTRYNMSSSAYRKSKREYDKSTYVTDYTSGMDMNISPKSIELRNEPDMQLIYVRYSGPYKGDSDLFSGLFNQLYLWAAERQLINEASRWLVIYHDYGDETEEDLLRISVCLSVHGNVAVSGVVGIMTLPAGKYGVGKFYVSAQEYGKAWYHMYAKWLPKSGYKIADSYAFEHYPPQETGLEKQYVEIYIPLLE